MTCTRITWFLPACLLVTLVVALQIATALPTGYDDYSEAEKAVEEPPQPSLYELLLQREMLLNKINEAVDQRRHSVVRKSERYPSLRLRFGKRSDPGVQIHPVSSNNSGQHIN